MLNPLQHTEANIMDDTDLAGPLVFCLAFGGCLLLVRDKSSIKTENDNDILLPLIKIPSLEELPLPLPFLYYRGTGVCCKYSLRHWKCGVWGFIHELLVSKTRTSEVRASEGF